MKKLIKIMKNTKCLILTILTLLMFGLNLLLSYNLYSIHKKEQTIDIENNFDNISKFNDVISGVITNANYTKESGYMAEVNDTIAIKPYLRVDFSSFTEFSNETPLLSLYEYRSYDTSFKFQDTIRYYGNKIFNYIVKDTGSKILLVRISLPNNDTIEKFDLLLPIHTKNKYNKLSSLPKDSELKFIFERFIKTTNLD